MVSAAAGVAIGLALFSSPMEKWQAQFSETFLPAQAEALQELGQGKPDKTKPEEATQQKEHETQLRAIAAARMSEIVANEA